MGISAAQFMHWLKDQASEITVLAEVKFGYELAGVPAEGTIYLADRAYVTRPTDSPANTRYRDVIGTSPDFERAIDVEKLGGRGKRSLGKLSLHNADGSLDFLLDALLDGRDINFYLGDKSWPRADFRLVNSGVVQSVKADNDTKITLELRDKNFLLDATIIGDPITSGPNTGKPKPIVLGQVFNFDVTPYLLSQADCTYYINNFPLHSTSFSTYVRAVRDAGGSLVDGVQFTFTSASMTANAGTDTLTRVAHGLVANDVVYFSDLLSGALFAGVSGFTQYWVISAGLTADDFRLSLTKGGAAIDITGTVMTGTWEANVRRFYVDAANAILQLSTSAIGRVTIDQVGIDAAFALGTSAEPHYAFKYILENWTRLTASEYDSTAITALAALESTSVYWGRAILDRTNVMDVLDEIAVASRSWYGWTEAGVLSVGRLDLSNLDAETAVDTIAEDDIEGDLACENLPLPWGKIILDTDRNVVVQTDGLLTTVLAADRTKWGQRFQRRVTTTDPGGADYVNDWWTYHRSAIDSKPVESSLASNISGTDTSVVVQQNCDDMTELFKPWTRVHRCAVGLDKYALNPGDCVTLTYPRYGVTAGKKCRVLSIKPRVSDRACDLVLVRQAMPDFTTSSHV